MGKLRHGAVRPLVLSFTARMSLRQDVNASSLNPEPVFQTALLQRGTETLINLPKATQQGVALGFRSCLLTLTHSFNTRTAGAQESGGGSGGFGGEGRLELGHKKPQRKQGGRVRQDPQSWETLCAKQRPSGKNVGS